MKPIAIMVAGIVLVFQWPLRNCALADNKLSEFYSQIASAKFGPALASIDEAISLWPSNARYYSWRAYCNSQRLPPQCPKISRSANSVFSTVDQQSTQDAIKDYRLSLSLNSRDAVAHHNLAWLEHLLGDNVAATEDWRKSTEIDPDNAAFHLSYGMFLEESGAVQTATDQYQMAVELEPSILDSPFFVSYRSRSRKEADLIVSHCVASLEFRLHQGNDPILEARLGKLYLYSGNLSRAAELLEDAARQLPNLPLVWFNLGEIYESRGDSTQAAASYTKAATIDASLAQPYLRLGQISVRAGQNNTGVNDLESALHKWQHMNPITAAHNNRLYGGPRQTIDDLLPTTLVWYISPCVASEAWRSLSQLFPQNVAYLKRTQTCEDIPIPHAGLE